MTKASSKTRSKATKSSGTSVKAKKTTTCSAEQLLGVIRDQSTLQKGKASLDAVASRAGYGKGSNHSFKKALSRAKAKGLIEMDKDVVGLTEQGQAQAGEAPPVETNEDAHVKIKEQLTKKMVDAFEVLRDGTPHSCEDLARALDYTSVKNQGFKKLLSRIKSKGFLEYADADTVQLTDICFPAGRGQK